MSSHATPPVSDVLNLAQRCRSLLGERREQKVISLTDAPQIPASTSDSLGNPHLSVSEIFLPTLKVERGAYDYLCLVCVEAAPARPGTWGKAHIHVIGPDSIRSHAIAISSGLLIGGFPVAPIRADDHDLSAALFKIKRSFGKINEARRIIEAIERLASALDYARDPRGSMALARAIIDRVELLSGSPDVTLLVGGTYVLPKGADARLLPHHVAFALSDADDQNRDFRVKDGKLCVVSCLPSKESGGPSPEATSEWREKEFLLLRVGVNPERQAMSRSIDELRRQYAPVQTSLASRDQNPEIESYYEKAQRIRVTTRLTSLYGQTGMQRLLAVTPIALEAAADLRPLLQPDEGELDRQFAQLLADMRGGLRHLFGFEVPSIRLRINDTDMPPGTYLIMLREIPLVMGTVDPSRGLCDAIVDRLASLNIEGDTAVNPANGNECSWVRQGDWQTVKDAGFRIWSVKEYIILHLQAVIRKNLVEFAGIQTVAQLLKDKDKERYSRILTAQGGLPRFTSVIQALLSEEVPITALPQICDCYLEHQRLPTHEIPEEIRCLEVVREDLFGNAPDTPIYRLGERLVVLIAEGIRPDGEAAVLALKPEPTQDALSAVRTEVTKLPPTAKNPVLFVEDWRMRTFVRKLVELEFPNLWVLSRREALAPDSRPVLATIELSSGGRPGKR
jgi:FHIPEP family